MHRRFLVIEEHAVERAGMQDDAELLYVRIAGVGHLQEEGRAGAGLGEWPD